jgi:hypothetical protein
LGTPGLEVRSNAEAKFCVLFSASLSNHHHPRRPLGFHYNILANNFASKQKKCVLIKRTFLHFWHV